MSDYHQLSLRERTEIARLHEDGLSFRAIGSRIGRSASTIFRELARNRSEDMYHPFEAQQRARERCTRLCRIDRFSHLQEFIQEGLRHYWSPEQIAGRMRCEKIAGRVCKETIYRYIYSRSGYAQRLWRCLPYKHPKRVPFGTRKRRGRKSIPEHLSITKRPKHINQRREFGHWEGDLVVGTSLRSENITTLLERKSRYSIAIKNTDKYAQTVLKNIQDKLESLPEKLRKSITFDQGSEFISYRLLSNIDVYYCQPKSPWQKGANENFNGRLRRFISKNTNLNDIEQNYLDRIINIMRRLHNYPF